MKRFVQIAFVCVLVAGLIIFALTWMQNRNTPQNLIERLRAERGDREELAMKISLARGDVIGALIPHFNDPTASEDFRAQVLRLLLSLYQRGKDDRVLDVVRRALEDSSADIRRAAADGVDTFMAENHYHLLAGSITDDDPEVRRHAYTVMLPETWRGADSRPWPPMSDEQLEAVVQDAKQQTQRETDPELKFLARSVLGRRVRELCYRAYQRRQQADMEGAEDFYRQAVELDPTSWIPRMPLARHYLFAGDREKAIQAARVCGGLIEIPRLKESPVVDGDVNDDVWKDAYQTDNFYISTCAYAEKEIEGKSQVAIGHRDGTIYFATWGYEDDLDQMKVQHMKRDGAIWTDDCVEILIDPSLDGKDRYQFIINPAGTFADAHQSNWKLNFKGEHSAQVFHDRGYWGSEVSLELKDLGVEVTPDTILSFCVYRLQSGSTGEHGGMLPTFRGTRGYHHFPLAVFLEAETDSKK